MRVRKKLGKKSGIFCNIPDRGGLEQQAGGIFSASDGGSGKAIGGGTRMASGVEGAEETVPRDRTSILGVWNSGEYSGEAGTSGRSGEPTAEMGGL